LVLARNLREGVNELGKKELTPLEEAAMGRFGDKGYTKQRLLGAERKAWRAAKKLSK
jgi:hypothetical protein